MDIPSDLVLRKGSLCDYETDWLLFIENKSSSRKTKLYLVMSKSKKDTLGVVRWYGSWRRYCFSPTTDFDTVFSDRCLFSIGMLIKKLNDAHIKKKNKESE